jgi:ABC-type glycerol-3-phosphate transport system substrate-binding protein
LKAFQLDDSVAQTVFGPVITSSGNYLCWNVEQILLYDQVGNLINKVKSENYEIMAIIASQNYTVAHVLYGEQSGFCIIDPNSGEFGEFMPSDHYMDSLSLCWGTEDILLINTGDALLSYNILTNENENLFNWQITSLDGYSIKCILAIETDKYVCMTSEKIYIVSTESQEVKRKVLTVASMGNANLEALAATFNQTNTDYYVEISYYSRTDLQRLNTELMTGNGPDILDMAGMSIPASSTYFEDLLPYIDRDAELQRENFVESILDSMLMNGKLTTILPSFCVQTLAGRTADVGSQSGWSMRDLTEALQKKGSGVSAFPAWLTSGELMLWVCNISNGQFVDWNTMSCQFDSDEFISLLEFCKDMPDVFMAEGYTSDYGKNTLLTVQVFQSASWLDTLKRNYSDDEITYIGFPNSNGSNGSFFAKTESEVRLAIPVQSRNKDAAWAFARSSLLGSYQEDVNGFPIIRSELDKRLSAALLQQDTVLLQEDVDKFSDLIEETTLFIYDDNTIRDIILEEALPYFTGTKTAEEAAAIINSRVSLYLSEHHF